MRVPARPHDAFDRLISSQPHGRLTSGLLHQIAIPSDKNENSTNSHKWPHRHAACSAWELSKSQHLHNSETPWANTTKLYVDLEPYYCQPSPIWIVGDSARAHMRTPFYISGRSIDLKIGLGIINYSSVKSFPGEWWVFFTRGHSHAPFSCLRIGLIDWL